MEAEEASQGNTMEMGSARRIPLTDKICSGRRQLARLTLILTIFIFVIHHLSD